MIDAEECDLTGGSSGGAWIGSGGSVVSVQSHEGYCAGQQRRECGHVYGPYMGAAAQGLYETLKHLAPVEPEEEKKAAPSCERKAKKKGKKRKPRGCASRKGSRKSRKSRRSRR